MNKQRWLTLVVLAVLLVATSPKPALSSFTPLREPEVIAAPSSLLHQASLKSGDYGAGLAINTMAPDHGGSQGVLGIVDSPDGVSYTSTETDNRSNALINWSITNTADRLQYLSTGSVSFMFKADRGTHVSGEIFGDNYGFTAFNNGQSTFATKASRIANGAGPEDDQLQIRWKAFVGSTWYWREPVTLEYDRWYHVGLAWGGPVNNYETWVCGELLASDSYASLPWGVTSGSGSATNVGLGDNHQRGYDAYGSAAGVTFTDIHIWNEYRSLGDTNHCIPTITSLSPASATAGGSAFTLTVNGTGFVDGASTVRWNGSDRATSYVSSTQLTASISAADIATAGTAGVTVLNSAPGGGISNPETFTINNPLPTITSLSPASATVGGPAFTLTVNGTDFVDGASTVRWNGSDRATTYVSSTQLTASISAADIATVGTASVTVFNSAPGGGTSNAMTFTIDYLHVYLPVVLKNFP